MQQTGSGIGGGILVIYAGSRIARRDALHLLQPDRHRRARPRPTPSACSLDVGAFGTGSTKIDSTYDFRALDTVGNRTLPGVSAGGNICIAYADVKATGDVCSSYTETGANTSFTTNTVSILGITELRGTGADLNGAGHLTVLTNGFIGSSPTPFAEYTGDLRLGLIDSTQSDVTLTSSRAILDGVNSLKPATAPNISAHDITLTAGDNLISADPNHRSGAGGVGTPGDFLGIHVNAHGSHGVLTVTDTAAPRANASTFPVLPLVGGVSNVPGAATGTFGVYVTQTAGDMTINTVTTNANASLRTLGGSILDGRNGGTGLNTGIVAPNVIADDVDLLAGVGSVGAADGTNDLKVYSSANESADGYCTRSYGLAYQDANYASATPAERAVTATCHLSRPGRLERLRHGDPGRERRCRADGRAPRLGKGRQRAADHDGDRRRGQRHPPPPEHGPRARRPPGRARR